MTPERNRDIEILTRKLKDCRDTCDRLHDEEQGHAEKLAENRMRIAADECKQSAQKIMNAFCNINDAITELEGGAR